MKHRFPTPGHPARVRPLALLLALLALLAAPAARAQVLPRTFAGGQSHSLSIHADGTLWATGDNQYGQLGIPTSTASSTTWVQVGTATNWVQVAAGASHSLGLRADGSLYAWGNNYDGQLGNATNSGTFTATPTPTRVGTDTYTQVAAGYYHSLGLRADGSLYAWGYNYDGELGNATGNGTDNAYPMPTRVGTATYTQVAAGQYHSLGLRADGSLYAWGYNFYGQLGNAINSATPNPTPTRVGTATYTQVAAGANHSLGLRADGNLYAWGANRYGQLGNATNSGTFTATPTPTRVGTDTYTQVAAGQYHSLSLRADGSLYAWGNNQYGQLGNATGNNTFNAYPTPTRVGMDTYTQAAAGYSHSLGLRADGSLTAWGYNDGGQLGNGSTSAAPTPMPTATGTALVTRSLAMGGNFGLAVRGDGTLWAWGSNQYGQLGQPTTTASTTHPMQVGTATDWVMVAAGLYHSLGLRADGSLYSWGSNAYGQLGNATGTGTTTATPTRVGTDTYAQVAAGQYHSLGLRADGSLYGWGSNQYGQLGNATGTGTTTAYPTPTRVGTDTDWVMVAAGLYHSLGLRADGSLNAWGYNYYGQLGTPRAMAPTPPTPRPRGWARTPTPKWPPGSTTAWACELTAPSGPGVPTTPASWATAPPAPGPPPSPPGRPPPAPAGPRSAPPRRHLLAGAHGLGPNLRQRRPQQQRQLGDRTTTNASRFDRVSPLRSLQPLPVELLPSRPRPPALPGTTRPCACLGHGLGKEQRPLRGGAQRQWREFERIGTVARPAAAAPAPTS